MTFVRYIVIQLIAYSIDMGVFIAFFYSGIMGPILSNVMGKIAAGIFAFFLHRRFTFRLDKAEHNHKQKYRYFFLLGVNIPIASLVLGFLLYFLNYPVLAKVSSDFFIVAFSFWLSKKWIFVGDTQVKELASEKKIEP